MKNSKQYNIKSIIMINQLEALAIYKKSKARKNEIINEIECLIKDTASLKRECEYHFKDCSSAMKKSICKMLLQNGFKIGIKANEVIRISF